MNKNRRKTLSEALPLIKQASEILAEARSVIRDVCDEEQDAYDSLSEGRQSGDMGEAMQSAISELEEALDGLEAIDLKSIAETVSNVSEKDYDANITPPKITDAEMEKRRMARLPEWAKDLLSHKDEKIGELENKITNMFHIHDGKSRTDIVVEDYGSPLRGLVLPAEMISLPSYGIRIYGDRNGRGVYIEALDMGHLIIQPSSSNVIIANVEKRF